jgi:hypothetical protein
MPRPRLIAKRLAFVCAGALLLGYLCDSAYFRLRMIHPSPGSPLETFTAPRLYAIAQKGGKVDYEMDAQNPQQTITCAHSIFPQARYSPCWYIKPKSQQPIPMLIVPTLALSHGEK